MGSKEKEKPDCLKRLSEEDFNTLKKQIEDGPSLRERWEQEKMKKKNSPEAEKKPDFKCPICGCKKYREHRSLIGEMRYGGENPTKLDCYSCAGCSVNFYNPTQFTNAGKKKRAAGKRRKE